MASKINKLKMSVSAGKYGSAKHIQYVPGSFCYDWGPGLSGPSTYWLWLWYKVCHVLLVTDYSISQHRVSHVR